jgi:hypothetical protein
MNPATLECLRAMHNLLIPVLILVVLPALYGAHRLGLWRRRGWRWIGGGVLIAVVALSMPYSGVGIESANRIKLLIAGATCLVLLLRYARVRWLADTTRYLGTLASVAVLAVVTHLNFFSFHGEHTFIHLHDVAHYYLGSKYFSELGYRDLYTAMLRAEAEAYDNHFKAIEARDLESYDRVHIRALLEKSDPVKAAFTPERWTDFKLDVSYFRDTLDRQYGEVLLDHGFNPTPLWVVIGSALSRWVPAGSETGILLLAAVSRRTSDAGATLLALPLLFFGLNLASYYYVFLIVIAAYLWRFPGRVALLFGAETATYCLLLFEDREGLLFVYRSVLMLYLVVALYFDSAVKELTRLHRRLGAPRSL